MTIKLGAQTHFGQGWNASLLGVARSMGVDMIRDSLPWAALEMSPGKYDFSGPRVAWLDTALRQGVEVTLTFAHTNALYDEGFTVYTDKGRAAFAAFVIETLKRYPNVTAIEIGNEYNSNSFVTGPVAKASAATRDDYYADLVSVVAKALDAAQIDVDLVGGATHSIPVDYYADLKALGTLNYLDAISIHPYTTPPEQFAQQIEVLRGAIGDQIAIKVTEFGDNFSSLDDAPGYLAKMVSVMGAAGIESASWYALARQSWFPNMELWNQSSGKETPGGLAFETIDALLGQADSVARIETDDFSYLYSFGQHSAVLWGYAGKVTLAAGVKAYDLSGNAIANFDGTLSGDTPIILKTDGTITAQSVTISDGGLVADSFTQFDVTNEAGGTDGFDGPWSYFAETGAGKLTPLYTMGGGLKAGEPWTPYLGTSWLRPLEINATSVTPADFGNGAKPSAHYAVVERFTSQESGLFRLKGSYDVSDSTQDGIDLTIRVDGKQVFNQHVYSVANGHQFSFDLEHIALKAGSVVDFVVDSGSTAKGDVTTRHIQIYAEQTVVASTPGVNAAKSTTTLNGPGTSPVDYTLSAGSVFADLAKEAVRINKVVTALKVDGVVGSHFADKLYGNDGANYLAGGDGNDRLFGREGDDHIVGGSGNDRLDGGAGLDRMEGGAGNDDYYVDDVRDIIAEDGVKGGMDTVWSTASYRLGDNLERLYLTGNDNIAAWGNALDNILKGNDGDNVLNGDAGRDKLEGGAGADTFVFDVLSGGDTVADFTSGVDRIQLSRDVFGALADVPAGALVHLRYGRAAGSPDDHLFYDSKSGVLHYDADGSGSGQATIIANLSGHPTLSAGDIFLA